MANEHILIVDDNPTNLKLLQIVMTIEGYEVRTAVDAKDVLRIVKDFRPRLILMDIQLPDMDGLNLTKTLKANPEYKDIIIIALTAYAMKEDEKKARDAGCEGYITKPFDPDELAATIKEFLKA